MIFAMILNEWRDFLYYPLGVIPAVFFCLRFVLQWIQSERVKQSIVFPLFWKLSLAGNLLALTHYFVQLQFPFVVIQAINAMISWRNLDLMKPAGPTLSTRQVLGLLVGVLVSLTAIFALQGLEWTRTPAKFLTTTPAPFAWHVLGTIGAGLFASRFWVQWWQAERHQESRLTEAFWWLTIVGNGLSLLYFARIGDSVSLINYGFSTVPAMRNLMLLARRSTA